MTDDNIKKRSLRFNSLPGTVRQLSSVTDDIPTIRSMVRSDRNTQSQQQGKPYSQQQGGRGAYRRYEPCQCNGCGKWGHRVGWCPNIPTIATCMKYIEKNKTKTAALVEAHLRLNNKNTKRSTVRMLQHTGAIDANIEPEEYLHTQDVEGDIIDMDLDDIHEE